MFWASKQIFHVNLCKIRSILLRSICPMLFVSEQILELFLFLFVHGFNNELA